MPYKLSCAGFIALLPHPSYIWQGRAVLAALVTWFPLLLQGSDLEDMVKTNIQDVMQRFHADMGQSMASPGQQHAALFSLTSFPAPLTCAH